MIAAVEGMGGVGKTELAIQYSLQHLKLNPGGICWLRGNDPDIGSQIIQFTRIDLGKELPDDLKLPEEKLRWCWQNWQQGNTLIVLDDVKNYSHIKPYLPPQPSQFKVLITTRLKLDLASSLFLSVLSETDALLLLAQLIGEEKQNQELGQAQELCQRLGYLPLALQLVGSYVKKRKIFLTEMLRRLEEKGLAHPSLIMKENDPTWTRNVKLGVAAAFELSWSDLSDDAQQLGCLLSLFANAPIPWSLVERTAVEQDQEELEDARFELEKLHLLRGEETYQLHQLIREFFRNQQNNLATVSQQKSQFCRTLVEVAQEIPESITRNLIESIKDIIPHLVEIARNLNSALSNEDLSLIFVGLTRFYESQGFYKDAQNWCEHRLSIFKQRLGEEHIDIADCYNNLSLVCYSQGSFKEAEKYAREALSMRQKLLDENHLDLSQSLHNLGTICYHKNSYFEAESLFKQALRIRIKHFTQKGNFSLINLDYLQSFLDEGINSADLNVQSSFILETFNFKSLFLNRRCSIIDYFLSSFDSDSNNQDNLILYLAESLNNLAAINRFHQRLIDSEILLIQSLKLRVYFFQSFHISVVEALNNLAGIYQIQGYHAQAENLLTQVLRMRRKFFRKEHPFVLESMNNLADIYQQQGRHREAECLFKKALDLGLREDPQNQAKLTLAYIQNNLAVIYAKEKEYKKAYELIIQALEVFKKILGETHPTTLYTYSSFNTISLKLKSGQ